MASKICSKCGIEKPLEEFNKSSQTKSGRKSRCKMCQSEDAKEYLRDNRDKIATKRKEQWENGTRKETMKKYLLKNKEKVSQYWYEYAQRNREKIRTAQRKYTKNNPEKCRKANNKSTMRKKEDNPMFRERLRITCLIYTVLKRKGYTVRSQVFNLVGVTYEQLSTHLGVIGIPKGYTLDHIVPFAQCQTIEEWHKLQNYQNLRLIPRKENEAKSDSKTPEGEILCRELLGREWVDKKKGRRIKPPSTSSLASPN